MFALQDLANEARERWKEYQPEWYRTLIKSRQRQAAVRAAADRMYRELTEREEISNCESVPMTVDRWRRMKLERKMRQVSSKLREEMRCKHRAPRVNILSAAPLDDQLGLSAQEMRVLKMAEAILAIVILGFVIFLVLWL